MQVIALLTLPKAADCMPIAPAVSGNDKVKDRQLQRKQHAAWMALGRRTEQQAAGNFWPHCENS